MDTKAPAQAVLPTDSIQSSGYPLGFMVAKGPARPGLLGTTEARDVLTVEARQFGGHQKEAVVHEGAAGSQWRMVSDEGKHIKGTDLAPFPLGFFNAGLHADLGGRIIALAGQRGISLDKLAMDINTSYSLTGSFTKGDAIGHAEPITVKIAVESAASGDDISRLVRDAANASPAIAALRTALTNTFAIYVNGRRRTVTSLAASPAEDAPDPYRTYARPPAPLPDADTAANLIHKTGQVREGEITMAPAGTTSRIIRVINGTSAYSGDGLVDIDTCLGLPGMSHFALKADESLEGDRAPCGLSLIAASIVFCYMTQISRYIAHMKFNIRGARIVQYAPYGVSGRDALQGIAEPVDTHLFLSGDESDEVHERLMTIAARTCYLHATLITELEPEISIIHNGAALG